MNTIKKLSAIPAILIISFNIIAQTMQEEKPSLDNGTVETQFNYLIEESNRYQDYKVVKITWLETLKSHVSDSLKAVKNELLATQNTVATQSNEIVNLKTELKKSEDNLAIVNREKNSVDFLGIPMNKYVYKSIMWIIAGALLALLILFIGKFKRSNIITVQAQKAFSEIQEEFETFKKRAREKEQLLKRELQNELNKQLQ